MANVTFLYGNDEFAIARKLKDFESDFADPTTAGMNTAHLEARSMSEDELFKMLIVDPIQHPTCIKIRYNRRQCEVPSAIQCSSSPGEVQTLADEHSPLILIFKYGPTGFCKF